MIYDSQLFYSAVEFTQNEKIEINKFMIQIGNAVELKFLGLA